MLTIRGSPNLQNGFFFNEMDEMEIFLRNGATQNIYYKKKKGKRKVQGVPQSQNAALPRPQEEEETDKLPVCYC